MVKEIYFVLGGPGSGKGTLCDQLIAKYGKSLSFFSAGDLLRAYVKSDPLTLKDEEKAKKLKMVQDIMKEGKIVPAEITVGLLFEAIKSSHNHYFLIDGFPRNEENSKTWDSIQKHHPDVHVKGLIFLACRLFNQ